MERAFRYQTGEAAEVARDLDANGCVEMDVIKEDRIKPFLLDLEGYGYSECPNTEWDYEAINFYDDHDFLCRVFLHNKDNRRVYIDFYCDYDEKSYDPIYLG